MKQSTPTETRLIGPFRQLLPLRNLPLRGPLADERLEVIAAGGVLVRGGEIIAVGEYAQLRSRHKPDRIEELREPLVGLPGLVDAHTHLCFAGDRSGDYAARLAGKSYLDIARAGGGIWRTVTATRAAPEAELVAGIRTRAARHLRAGVTTVEVKSGYGLSVAAELKQLRAIRAAQATVVADLVPTCLAAHITPRDFAGDAAAYLRWMSEALLPQIQDERLSNRVDIFVEETAFDPAVARPYLESARARGFELTVHADQFSTGGSALAVALGARSADHLEASDAAAIDLLARSQTVAVALPGASLGLGMAFAPARRLLDAGAILAIASDWNPGSAPMGDLLTQAALLGAYEKLTTAETLAGITCRAAAALGLTDRGSLAPGQLADLVAFPAADCREILYQQGQLRPVRVWKRGRLVGGGV
jgi:imidazolonepropionase